VFFGAGSLKHFRWRKFLTAIMSTPTVVRRAQTKKPIKNRYTMMKKYNPLLFKKEIIVFII
jgi:hypothetical protein